MATVNEQLLEDAVTRALQLTRLTASERANAVDMLSSLARELAAELYKLNFKTSYSDRHKRNIIKAYIKTCEKIVHDTYAKYGADLNATLSGVAELEGGLAIASINSAVGMAVVTGGLSAKQIESMMSNAWVNGLTMQELLASAEESFIRKFKEQIRIGYMSGEGIDKMVRRITGYTDTEGVSHEGIGQGGTRRSAETLVRTAVMGISNQARQASFKENQDVIKGMQWVATLDNRTCIVCASLDGKVFTVDGQPVDGDTPNVGEPPVHPGCRCTWAPITKSFAELGIDGFEGYDEQKDSTGTRASMDGQVARKLDFEEWFDSKGAAFQAKWLGRGRYDLWKNGKISFRDLIDQNGRQLTLEQLRKLVEEK